MFLLRNLAGLYHVNAFGHQNEVAAIGSGSKDYQDDLAQGGVPADFDFDTDSDDSEESLSIAPEEMFSKRVKGPDAELWSDGKMFSSVVAVSTVANTLVLGMEAEMAGPASMDSQSRGELWAFCSNLFTALFVIEVSIRMADAKPRRFFVGERTKVKYKLHMLNLFDSVIIFLRVLDVWLLSHVGINTGLRQLSVFRLLRLGPCVKNFDRSGLREASIVASAIWETLKTLFFVIIMLAFVIAVFSVLVKMAVMIKPAEVFNYDRAEWDFDQYWGTVMKAAYSLFQLNTKDKWSNLVQPLLTADGTMVVLFGGFYVIAPMALMNAIVGVVVESTLANSKVFAEAERKEKERAEEVVMNSLREIFREGDVDNSGELDIEELHNLIRKWEVRQRLKMLQIPFADLDAVFALLDEEEEIGTVNIDMFFRACSKLRGQARAVDIHQLNIDLRGNLGKCEETSSTVTLANLILSQVLTMVDDIDVCVMQGDMDSQDPVYVRRQGRSPKTRAAQFDPNRPFHDTTRTEKKLWQELENAAKTPNTSTEAKPDLDESKVSPPEAALPEPPPLPTHVQVLAEYTRAALLAADKKKSEPRRKKGDR